MPEYNSWLRSKRLRRLRGTAGKFSKGQAYYVDDSFQKPFRCGNCEYFNADSNTCNLVSEEGSPGVGVISPRGACSLFNARPARITALQWLWGRDEENGIAPEKMRATAFMFTYAALDEEPPADLRQKALIDPDDIPV